MKGYLKFKKFVVNYVFSFSERDSFVFLVFQLIIIPSLQILKLNHGLTKNAKM